MPDYEVVMPNPMPFSRWNCYGCAAGSGTVYRPAADEGTPVREQAYKHMRRTGHAAYLERGTREELATMATTVVITTEAHRRTHTLADPVDGCPWCAEDAKAARGHRTPPPPAEGAEAWCAQTAALGPHRIRYEAGEWIRCDNGTQPLASVCRSGDDEPTPHRPAPRCDDDNCTVCGRLAGVPTAPCPACPDTQLPPPTGTSEAVTGTDWAGEACRLGRRLGQHAAEARVLQALQLPPPGPDGKWKVQLHTGTSPAEALQLYAATEPLFDCGYPHGDPGPAAHQAAAAITGHQRLEADLEAAAQDRHDRTHTTAGPTPGCPWCAMAQAGDDDA